MNDNVRELQQENQKLRDIIMCTINLMIELEEKDCTVLVPTDIVIAMLSDSDDFKKWNEQPTDDVKPVVHAEWVDNEIPESILYACSNCGFPSGAYSFNYCPNCGAKMDNDTERYIRDIFVTR